MTATGEQPARQVVKLVIKNPSKPGASNFETEVAANATVMDVKLKLARSYEGNPQADRQVLIHAGKVLKNDDELLHKLLRLEEDPLATYILHLVIKGREATPVSPLTATSTARPNNGVEASGRRSAVEEPPHSSQHPSFYSVQSQFAPQAGYSSSGWSATHPDPTILAAYNAALESLRNRPAWPVMSQNGAQPRSQGPAGAAAQMGVPAVGAQGHPGFLPPFSIAPTVLLPPASAPHASGPHATSSRPGAEAASSSSAPSSSSGTAGLAGAQAGTSGGSRVPQLYAPALTYVPVNLVQQTSQTSSQQHPQPQAMPASTQGPAQAPQAPGLPGQGQAPQQLFPYPHFAPMLPMMMPFGPYAQQMFPNNQQPPGLQLQQPGAQHIDHGPFQPAHMFRGMPQQPAPAAVQLGQNARLVQPGPAPVRVRLIRINLKLLLQLCILGLVVYQNMPHARFLKLVGGIVAVYFLWPMVNRNNAVQRQFRRFINPRPPRGPPPAPGQNAPQNGNEPGVQGHAAMQPPAGGLLHEIQALLVGFFTSLLPGFNMNAEDAAAFAQAQQILAQEGERQGMGREHVD